MKVDLEALNDLVDQKLLSVQKHPDFDLLIWNYSPMCQYDKENWNEHTLMCRGLITREDGTVVSRPFPKFFNLGEHTDEDSPLDPIRWDQRYEVTDKFDGSLGITYLAGDDTWRIATRGSFTSNQAVKGTDMLWSLMSPSNHPACLDSDYTYLFEIIYPENRIVVDYGDQEKLVLLTVIETKTGRELDHDEVKSCAGMIGCDHTKLLDLSMDAIQNFSSIKEGKDSEGIVVRFQDGTRIKVKLDEYVRLHKILTGINKRHIWERLIQKRGFEDILEVVPDEFMQWVRDTIEELTGKYDEIEKAARTIFLNAKLETPLGGRKEFAMKFTKPENVQYSAILFKMLDDKPYDRTIWKMLRPEATEPFHTDIDG
jgi:RNA ligase